MAGWGIDRHHFSLIRSGPPRLGLIKTAHGNVETPAFCPVGTAGSVKSLTPEDLTQLGVSMILCNAYHLYLRPGIETVTRLGGLHKFMAWPRPILTDSGGYQIFSMKKIIQISEEGVTFQSHLDGSRHDLTPEQVIRIEEDLGADIIMPLDECPAYSSDEAAMQKALSRTLRWAERCRRAHQRADQFLYGILQGGCFHDLRYQALDTLVPMGFDGYAIGGLAVGEPREMRLETLERMLPHLPQNAPRYLMGVGTPEDLIESVALGVDLFDCVLPTRHARTGALLTSWGSLNIRNACYREDARPIDPDCSCSTCALFSRAYLRHLFMSREILGIRLNTLHNLYYYLRLMVQMRKAIADDAFDAFRADFYRCRLKRQETI